MTQTEPAGSAYLRPLTLGETLDRAVTLVVRNAGAFALIGLVYVVPLAVMQYFLRESTAGSYQQLLDQIQGHPNAAPNLSAIPWGWFVALIAFSAVFSPFVVTAYAAAVGAVYTDKPPDWRTAYSVGLRKAGAILLAEVGCVAILFGAVFVFAFGFGISFGIVAVLAQAAAPLAVILGIVAALVSIGFLLLVAVIYLALGFALLAIPLEDASVGAAFSRGFARVFTRGEFGRALLVCLCFFALYIVNFILSGGVAMLLVTVTRLPTLDVVVQAVLQLFFFAFFAALLAVYYFDVRVRREGFDIQRQLEELDAAARA